MNKKFKELVGNTLIFALGSLGSKLIVFLLVPLYTNLMTPSEYGTAELVFTIAQMLFPFVSVVIFERTEKRTQKGGRAPLRVRRHSVRERSDRPFYPAIPILSRRFKLEMVHLCICRRLHGYVRGTRLSQSPR